MPQSSNNHHQRKGGIALTGKNSLSYLYEMMIMMMLMFDDRFGEMIRSVGLCNIDCFKPTTTAK